MLSVRACGEVAARSGLPTPLRGVDAALSRATIPIVSERGRQLAEAATRLRAKEAASATKVMARTLDTSNLIGDAILVVPVQWRADGQLRFLLPAGSEHEMLGVLDDQAAGRTSAARKHSTKAAETLLEFILGRTLSPDNDGGVRSAPAVYMPSGGVETAVIAAWVPTNRTDARGISKAGLMWHACANIRSDWLARIIGIIKWTADGWSVLQVAARDAEARLGAIHAAPTHRDSLAELRALDSTRAEKQLRRDLGQLSCMLEAAAEAETHIAAQVRQWRDKIDEAHSVKPPDVVARLARRPRRGQFDSVPFQRRCVIPTTEPAPQRWPPPRWPPGVPKPRTALATYTPDYRTDVHQQMERVSAWNARTVRDEHTPRP